ncbi:MAG TPA: UbiA family prenyltransferase [Candidatus Methanoperedens sp.]
MCWRKASEILRLCSTPASIISPFPLFAVSLFLLSGRELNINDLPLLFAGIAVSLLSSFGSNLWNHCNDINEDKAAGKSNILTQETLMHKTALLVSTFLYICSILLVYYLSMELKRPIYLYFLAWVLVTWWYSDNFLCKRIIGFRLKDHYMGELFTYAISGPAFTLSMWLIYSDFNAAGLIIALAFLFFIISMLLLKDLKDISGDRKAGLRTFGVVFSPSQLVRYSSYLLILYFLVILNPITINLLGMGILVLALPFFYFFKNTFVHMCKKNWTLDRGDLKALKSIGYSVYASVIFLGLAHFF